MMFPIVPRERSRLRFFVNSAHDEAQIDHTVETLARLHADMPPDRGLF